MLLRSVIIFLWEVIYVHIYNWDRSLDLVLVVYDMIELIIEASVWTMDDSTFVLTHNTQDSCSTNAYFICMIVHDQMWWVYSIACQSNPKIFLSILYVFESVFMLSCFKFLVKLHFSWFSSKTSSEAFLREARN